MFASCACLRGASDRPGRLVPRPTGRSASSMLRKADLGGAQLQGATLQDAQLQGALLDGAELQGAYLLRANLRRESRCSLQSCGRSLLTRKSCVSSIG